MKFPKHILFDMRSNCLIYSNQYWTQRFFFISEESFVFKKTCYFFKFLLLQNKTESRLFNAKQRPTPFTKNYFSTDKKTKSLISIINFLRQNKFNKNFSTKRAKRNNSFNLKFFPKTGANFANSFQSLFVINFLKKEKLYTKLKYSRVPQYDSVSGGSAALLAGFLGFLICEKFGFELLDSGDFYFFFMYVVFFLFFSGLFVKITAMDSYYWNIVNFKNLWMFYYTHALLGFKNINGIAYR